MMRRIWNWLTSPCEPSDRWHGGVQYRPAVDMHFEVSRLDLRPGDLLVLKFKEHLSPDAVNRIKDIMFWAAEGHKCVVLDGGAEMAVLTAAEIEAKGQTQEEHAG